VVGFGHLALGAISAAGLLLTLELPHIPGLRHLDARDLAARFENDEVFKVPDEAAKGEAET